MDTPALSVGVGIPLVAWTLTGSMPRLLAVANMSNEGYFLLSEFKLLSVKSDTPIVHISVGMS